MADYQTQYRPLQTRETAGQDCLSTRVMDLARGVNNAALVLSPKLWSQAWPTGNYGGRVTANGDERIFAPCVGPLYVADCYDTITWTICAAYIGSAVTFRLYSMASPFFGTVDDADLTDIIGPHHVSSIAIDSTSSQVKESVRSMGIARTPWGYTSLMLTCDGAAGSSGELRNIDVTAQISEAY